MILLRGGAEALELLLVRRTPKARFMGGVWVFPGGAVDAGEGDGDGAHRLAAIRELHEEAAVELSDPAELVKFSRWITPAAGAIRFDTHFFLATLPARPGAARSTARSASTSAGSRPRARSTRTRRARSCSCSRRSSTSSSSASSRASTELLDYARGREVLPVEPRVVMEGEVARILLPGEAGYDARRERRAHVRANMTSGHKRRRCAVSTSKWYPRRPTSSC